MRILGVAVSALALAVTLGAAGCATQVPTPSPAPSPSPSPTLASVLLTVTTRGGLCADGPCGSSVFLERDGRVHLAAKPPNDLGVVGPADLSALEAAIRATDFDELRSHRFSGTCPTAYDGPELIFEFGAPSGVERIAGCEVEIDWASPLFVAVAGTIGPFVALPPS